MTKSARPKLVLVEWLDACSFPDSGWNAWSDIVGQDAVKVLSVGYVLTQDTIKIVLASTISGEDNPEKCYVKGDITIPLGMVTKITELKYGKQKGRARRQTRRSA